MMFKVQNEYGERKTFRHIELAIDYAKRAAKRYEPAVYSVVDTRSGLVLCQYWYCAGVVCTMPAD